ncbi:MAG: MarC family protein [Spirochaetes bacterium]|nr:MarC family protein [Spirochaetota bacterium]
MMTDFIKSTLLLLVLLNPFLVIIYLTDIMAKLDGAKFRNVLIRAGLIAVVVFCSFAILGTAIFSQVFQVEFASFQVFGGVVFLLIGLQFVFKGPNAIEVLRGESEHIAGAVAMPVLIGPGTISASVVIGERHNVLVGCAAVILATTLCIITIFALKKLHDYVRYRREALIQRYIEIAGRITALFVGSVAIEMMFQGLFTWLKKIS